MTISKIAKNREKIEKNWRKNRQKFTKKHYFLLKFRLENFVDVNWYIFCAKFSDQNFWAKIFAPKIRNFSVTFSKNSVFPVFFNQKHSFSCQKCFFETFDPFKKFSNSSVNIWEIFESKNLEKKKFRPQKYFEIMCNF